MFNMWVLIIFLANGSSAGGPTTAYFQTQHACEAAAATVRAKSNKSVQWHVCVPMQ